MHYFRLPGMTRRQAVSLWWYNNILRHWHNWRIRRMWKADPNRPEICVKAGAFSPRAWEWALQQAEKIENERAAHKDENDSLP